MPDVWYRALNGQTEGPLTLPDLQRMAQNATLKPTDSISHNGEPWRPASEFPEIQFPPTSIQHLNYPSAAPTAPFVTTRVIELLRQTSLWVRIMFVILVVSTGLMVLGALAMFAMTLLIRRPADAPPFVLLGILYLVLSIFYIPFILYLHRYASHAKAFAKLRTEQHLEEAMQAQKSFWKYLAILTLVMIGVYFLIVIPAIIIGTILAHR